MIPYDSEPTFEIPEAFPTPTTVERIHIPRVFAEHACLDRCGKLAGTVGSAALKAIANPERQYDVVCLNKGRFGCAARVVSTGQYSTFGSEIEDSDELFLRNPSRYEGGGSPEEDIQQAIDKGLTPHHPREIKRR